MIFLKGFWLSHVFAIFKIPLPFIFFIPIHQLFQYLNFLQIILNNLFKVFFHSEIHLFFIITIFCYLEYLKIYFNLNCLFCQIIGCFMCLYFELSHQYFKFR
jgi:hypothetical protein